MAACELCWRSASFRAAFYGGSVVDHYCDVLAQYPDGHVDAHTPEASDASEGAGRE